MKKDIKSNKYKFVDKKYESILNDNETPIELLNLNDYTNQLNDYSEINDGSTILNSYNIELENYNSEIVHYNNHNFINEVIHSQMNYSNNNDFKKEENLEKIKLINDEKTNDTSNIILDVDYEKERDGEEIQYNFENKYEDNFTHILPSHISEEASSFNSILLISLKVILIILVILLIVFVFTKFKSFIFILQHIIQWVSKQGSWSILLFILLFILTAPLFMSVEIMCIGSGLIFSAVYGKILGLFIAVFAVSVGYVLGMSLCFVISRYLIHDFVYRKLITYPIYMAFNQAIDTNGLSFVLLIRLSPILPAALVSYILGVTSLKYKHFALGSVSALPSIFLFTYIGVLLQDFSNLSELESHWGNIIILIIGFIIGIVAIVYITLITKRRLNAMNIINSSLTTRVGDLE